MTQLPLLKNGSKSEAVKGLKNALMTRADDFDLFDRPLSQDFGPKTDKAVRSFQYNAGLDADGVVGPKTWDALVVHLVESGDTLSSIAEHALGDPNRFGEIYKLNGELLYDPDRIFPGQVLTLPIHGC
jgi:nucleoid-associated protein YgaU